MWFTWCLLLLLCAYTAAAQLQVVSTETNQVLNASNIVVGTASDLALQVRCQSFSNSSTITWMNGTGSGVSQGLSAFGVSQENGVLRVYPVTMLSEGVNTFNCTDGTDTLTVQFDRRPHLFFTSPVPEQAPATVDVTTLCPVPDIPAAMVTVVNGTGFSYCTVSTARGSFRSRSIITEEEPTFRYEPADLVVRPFNESSRAAFSCSVLGIRPIVNIQWYFEVMQFGSGMGILMGPMNGMLTTGTYNITIFSGADVTATRTSVLLLENVGNQHEGLYRCEVTFGDGRVLTSRNASLMFNATPATEETIVLAPPSSLTVINNRNSLLLPCVSSEPTLPSFSRSGVVTQFGLEILAVTESEGGVYTCTVGGVSVGTIITVADPFPTTRYAVLSGSIRPPEVVLPQFSEMLSVFCIADESGAVAVLLRNTNILASSMFVRQPVIITDETLGFYQCGVTRSGLGTDNLLVGDTASYALVTFVRNTAVNPSIITVNRQSSESANVTLACTTRGNPLPRLSWTVNGIPSSNGVQAVTGFMETASSTLTLSVAELNLGENLMGCIATVDAVLPALTETASATVTVEDIPDITTPPVSVTVVAPDQAVFTCSAEGFPLPSISWMRVNDDGSQIVLTEGGNIMISESSTSSTTTSTFTLSPTDITLNGNYSCVATNSLGMDQEQISLTVNDVPVITTLPMNVTVEAPQAAMFTCSAEGSPVPTISWQRIALDGVETVIVAGGNIMISESSSGFTTTSNLTLSPTDIRLNGVYVCITNNSLGTVNSSAVLTVNAAPLITTPPVNVTVVAPDEAVFTCSAEGFPLPSVSWRRFNTNGLEIVLTEGGNIMVSNSSTTFTTTSNLTLSPTDHTLNGVYACTATNDVGSVNASAVLTVNAAPVFLVDPVEDVLVVSGDVISLNCSAQGNPIPTISWMVANSSSNMTTIDANFTVNISSAMEVFTQTSVVSFEADLTDPLRGNGTMVYCVATNSVMADVESNRTTVTIAGPPLRPAVNTSVTSRSALISWDDPFSLIPITNYTITIMSGDTNISMETVSGNMLYFNATALRPNTNHTVTVVAVNRAGESEGTTEVFTTLEDDITTPPENVTVVAPEPAMFTCSAEGFPLPSISWRRIDLDGLETVLTEGRNINISVSSSGFTINSNLTLSPTDISLNGVYVCIANTTQGTVNASAMLTVNAAPVLTALPMNITVMAPDEAVFTCSAEGFPLPSISWSRFDINGLEIVLTEGANIMVSNSSTTFTTTNNLTLSPTDLTLNGVYVCTATNDIGSNNASAVLTVNAAPVFLVDPVEDVLVVSADIISLNCSAQGNPLPTISWMVANSNRNETTIDANFNVSISSAMNVFTQTSVVSFEADLMDPLRGNGTMVYCVANNSVMADVESNRTTVTIAGPPLRPAVNTSVTSRSALVSWDEPFSLIPITNYTITIMSGDTNVTMETVSGNMLYFNATALRPNTNHTVTVVAVNRAGESEGTTEVFTTLEDVPDGFPGTVESTSRELRVISVSWSRILDNETNGVITGYSVRYRLSAAPMTEQLMNVTGGETLSVVLPVTPGDIYLISVAGRTVIGLGPYSTPEVNQTTIPEPPTFPSDPLPTAGSPSVSTIPITLPDIPGGLDSFSHYWVVVVRSPANFDQMADPSNVYNNSVFTNYSSSVPANTPYVAAEIRSANYQPSMTFVLGDEEGTMSINDFPDLYRNGPLQQGSAYTAFVRAFPFPVANGVRAKRQSGAGRQYTVFVSSRFLPLTSTALPPGGLSGGGIAGIVIALIFILILVLAIVIVLVMLYERSKLIKEIGLPQPPSRKGSMRIRDQREIIPSATTLRNLKAEAELQNLSPDDSRTPVLVEDFPAYVKTMHANTDHLFSEEYEILSIKSPSLPHVQCSMPYNVPKNRYANINSFDDTRVKLEPIPTLDGSDYINANYMDGYLEKKGFIAAQGPLAQTTPDFWRMVWEQNSCCVIMLTNVVEKNRAKCHQYWPEVGSLNLGDITVTLIEVQQLAYYTVRTFRMSRGNDRREVKQFHYTGWPDFGVPDYPHPVIAFIKRVNNFKRTTPGPYVVHCSAGVGRTGTLMTVQAMMQMMEEEGKLDIFNFVLGLRHQRNYMVQTERQYIFIHDCILEIIKMGETSIPIQTLRRRHKELLAHNPHMDTSKMEAEYAHLNELQTLEEPQFEPARLPVNQPKNRFPDILPYDRYRVRLLLHPGVAGSDYINASYVDGYQHRHQYIVTQGPMKHTVLDFWRMIWEHRVSCILMLCPLEEKGKEQSVRYWPTEKINQQGDMFIELTQHTDYGSYTMREFSITNTKINESRVIKHYQYSDWLEDTMPTNAATIIDLIGVLQKTQHMLGGGPIVVHDSSSVGRSATFCILGSILEQLKVEGTVDLFSSVHSLRHQQPGLISSFELYKFCYQAVIEFLDSFDHYANFD